MSTSWARHAIVWQVYPLGALNTPALAPIGDPSDPHTEAGILASEHRLSRLINWLDHLLATGCSVLALGPIFASMSHGYDTVDYLRIDPRLGTNEDFDALVAAAHERGIRIILDGVFNHTGKGYPAFACLAQEGPDSPNAELYRLTWPENWTPGVEPAYERFEDQDWLPALNHHSPAVADLVVDVMCHWLERGADGWRLDAAYAVDPAFWTRVLPRVRERFPAVYIVGEVIHGEYAHIVEESGMDSVTQYELWKAIWSSLENANFWELDWAMGRHQDMLETFVPWTFVSNHDTTRVASQISAAEHRDHAAVLLMTLPGLPAIYYGDEVGMTGIKEERLGGDDAIRPPLPNSPAHFTGDQDLSDPHSVGSRTMRLYQELISWRRRLPWLHDAVIHPIHVSNCHYALGLRQRAASDIEAQRITVVLSLEETPTWIPTEGRHTVLCAPDGGRGIRPERDGVVVPPHGWAVLGS